MVSLLKADLEFAKAYELTGEFLSQLGIKVLIADLDNTLAMYENETPDDGIKRWADSLKEQLKIEPLDKISIAEICDRCNLNRKSFYYHFEDKTDLINWIFDTEYLSEASKKSYATQWESVENLCRYLYLNKSFYKKIPTELISVGIFY